MSWQQGRRRRAASSIRRNLLGGVAVLAILSGGVGGWAATTELAGAILAHGIVVVDSNVKKVQHPGGGIVGELRARDGDHVKAGDVLVRLDETRTRANLAIITKGLDELAVKRARLEAERDGSGGFILPPELTPRVHEGVLARAIESERRLMALRAEAREGQKAQLRERAQQLREEIRGLTAQKAAKAREREMLEQELVGVRDLKAKQFATLGRVLELERLAARIDGEIGSIVSSAAQARGKISELELQTIQIDQDLRTQVGQDLREIEGKVAELEERRVAAEDELKRVDIRAPQDGIVHQSAVHTVGGVIAPGDVLMQIVPDADILMVEAQVAPQDIDQIRIGQTTVLRLSAFNQRTTPEIDGVVSRVSADLVENPKTGALYYTVRIAFDKADPRLKGLAPIPGMPAEAFVRTDQRTVLSYLVKPLADQVTKAFREE